MEVDYKLKKEYITDIFLSIIRSISLNINQIDYEHIFRSKELYNFAVDNYGLYSKEPRLEYSSFSFVFNPDWINDDSVNKYIEKHFLEYNEPNRRLDKYIDNFKATVLDFKIKYVIYCAYGFLLSEFDELKIKSDKNITIFNIIKRLIEEESDEVKHTYLYDRCHLFSNVQTNKFDTLRNKVIENYLMYLKMKIIYDEIIIDNFTALIGNGNSIEHSNEFLNGAIVNKILTYQDSLVSRRLLELYELFKYLVEEYYTFYGLQLFIRNDYNYRCPKSVIYMSSNNNYYMMLFYPHRNSIDNNIMPSIEEVGIESYMQLEQLYYRLHDKKDFNFQFEDPNYRLPFSKVLKDTIFNISCSKFNKPAVNIDMSSHKVFTTNYDLIIEDYWKPKETIHLHGSVNDDIICGATYEDKGDQSNPYYLKEFSKVKGTLLIHGYSGNYNDEHINKVIRENKHISTIIFSVYKLKDVLMLDDPFVELRRIFQFFCQYDDKKKLLICDSDLVYSLLYNS